MAGSLHEGSARVRIGLQVAAAGCVLLLAGCIGGPHPLPPDRESSSPITSPTDGLPTLAPTAPTIPNTPAGALPGGAPPASMSAAGSLATPPLTGPAAGSGAMTPTQMPTAANGGAAGSSASGSAGSSAPPSPSSSAGSGGTGAPGTTTCDGATAPLHALEIAPRNLLFVLDRSAEMAGDFDGSPRWQMASQALMHTLSARANDLTLGALLYPSSARADCAAPDWVCALQQTPMCTVNPLAAADQVAFQPAAKALGTLIGSSGVYAPVMAAGVPLGESLQRADTALTAQSLGGETAVVIVASGMPTCEWDAAQAHDTIARWKSRGVPTYVVTLPGSPDSTSQALASLAEAGGTDHVRTPSASGSLEATLQSIVFDSLSTCTLELDPPATDANNVQLLVTQGGVERSLARISPIGEAQWTISMDGKTVTLLGSACDAAKRGSYEALRVVLSCALP